MKLYKKNSTELSYSVSQKMSFRIFDNKEYSHFSKVLKGLKIGHIGASWTEGPKWDFQFKAFPMKNLIFTRAILQDISLSFKMTYWKYM